MMVWILSKLSGIKVNWKLTLAALLVAATGTSLYACSWEKAKVAVKQERVEQARAQLEVLEKHTERAAIKVQEAQQDSDARIKEVDNAVQQSSGWGDNPVPDSVRIELCATLNCAEAD